MEGILRFKMGWTVKTAGTNSSWAYIREGLLSEGYLRLRFGGLIFGRVYFFFGGGGAYYRNFTVFDIECSLQTCMFSPIDLVQTCMSTVRHAH